MDMKTSPLSTLQDPALLRTNALIDGHWVGGSARFTVNDPTTWTKPWTATVLLRSSPEPIFEMACHEGNEGLAGALSGHRAVEKAASAQGSK